MEVLTETGDIDMRLVGSYLCSHIDCATYLPFDRISISPEYCEANYHFSTQHSFTMQHEAGGDDDYIKAESFVRLTVHCHEAEWRVSYFIEHLSLGVGWIKHGKEIENTEDIPQDVFSNADKKAQQLMEEIIKNLNIKPTAYSYENGIQHHHFHFS